MKKLLIPVLVILMLAFGCNFVGSPTCSALMPQITKFNSNPPSISPGGSSTLTWDVSGASTITIDQGIGNVALTGNRTVSPTVTTTYNLVATNSAGTVTATAQVIVTGTTPSPSTPVISSFTASPDTITIGGTSTLNWNVSNATSVTIDQGIGPVSSTGNKSVSPTGTTVYTLTATNASGSITASAIITVSGAPSPGLPVINYFNASPNVISSGGTTTLSWSVSNATSVIIDHGIGNVGLVGTVPAAPSTTTNYTLTATNASGWYSNTIVVLVTGAIPTSFAVTGVTASVSPASFTGPCPKAFNFTGIIMANGPGTVTYRWERSDGASSSAQSVTFPAAGSVTVTTSWTLSSEGTKWERLHVLSPNDMTSNQATFTLDCTFTVTSVTASVSPNSFTGACPKAFNFTGVITTNGPVTVTYRWERSDGASSTVQSVTFPAAGSTAVNTSWTLSAEGTRWERLHILTPNDMTSNQATFTLDCVP